jgi:F-type H+-transporting ATPase subunit a
MPGGIFGIILTSFMLLVEIISHFARPFSLAVRLFANMTAGHLVIMVFISLIFMISAFITPVSVVMAVVMMAFEIFVSVLQAFIFAILASIYISLAVHAEH